MYDTDYRLPGTLPGTQGYDTSSMACQYAMHCGPTSATVHTPVCGGIGSKTSPCRTGNTAVDSQLWLESPCLQTIHFARRRPQDPQRFPAISPRTHINYPKLPLPAENSTQLPRGKDPTINRIATAVSTERATI